MLCLIKQSDSPVRTSSESTVRRPGKAPEGAVPESVPRPARDDDPALPRGAARASSPTADGRSGTGTPVPSLRANPFSRGYGSILPTPLPTFVSIDQRLFHLGDLMRL
ncbi:hypothetical protein Salat_2961400 [Sesamum alatum]|uniref:Uncharacterized protein n=1 Tax=Sesamum alatum TaxID=300844 RepID=A0AAE1XIR5_9LAMI|nr:hypothetical protein Salat_2961400 [Sesamum alatum]